MGRRRAQLRSRRSAAACGLGAAALALVVPLAGGSAEPGYSHVAQFISELGAVGATHSTLVAAAGFAPIGALVLGFLAFAAGLFPRSRRSAAGVACLAAVGASYLASALFHCDAGCPSSGSFSQSVHNLFGFFQYAGAMAGLLLLGSAFRGSPDWRSLAPVCVVSAAFVAAGFVAMLMPDLDSFRGLSQRVAESSIFSWFAYTSVFLLRLRTEAES
jgi:hypothetical protein